MNATLDPTAIETECEAPASRISAYFAAAKPKRQLPKTSQERHELLSDCVMEAILAARDLLANEDSSIVLKAAETILKVERTRIRHDRNVSGCKPPLMRIDPSELDEALPSVPQENVERTMKRGHTIGSGNEEMMLAQLEKMFGIEEEEENEEVPAPIPVKPASGFAATEEEAMNWHIEELHKGFRKAEEWQPGSVKAANDDDARKLVHANLNKWGMKAIDIPKGGFWRTVASRMKKATIPTSPNAI